MLNSIFINFQSCDVMRLWKVLNMQKALGSTVVPTTKSVGNICVVISLLECWNYFWSGGSVLTPGFLKLHSTFFSECGPPLNGLKSRGEYLVVPSNQHAGHQVWPLAYFSCFTICFAFERLEVTLPHFNACNVPAPRSNPVTFFFRHSFKKGALFKQRPLYKLQAFPYRWAKVFTICFSFWLQCFDFLFGGVKQPIYCRT